MHLQNNDKKEGQFIFQVEAEEAVGHFLAEPSNRSSAINALVMIFMRIFKRGRIF